MSKPTSYIRNEVEAAPSQEIARLQLKRLQAGVDRVPVSVPLYRERLSQARVHADSIHSLVEAPAEIYGNQNHLVQLEKRLSFGGALGIACNVKLVGPREIERSEGKARRVIDKRTQ